MNDKHACMSRYKFLVLHGQTFSTWQEQLNFGTGDAGIISNG